MKKTTLPIKGMHCKSCELLIEDELKSVKCVCRASASHSQSHVHIWHEDDLDTEAIRQAIAKAGYQLGKTGVLPWVSGDSYRWLEAFLFSIIILLLVWIAKNMGLALPSVAAAPTSLFVILLVGLTAGFSTCMALIGGLILSISTRYETKFQSHLIFNLGRILGYGLFGGLIGVVGSVFQLSGYMIAILTIAVALVMVLLGLQLTGLFPRLETFKFTLPKFFSGVRGIHSPFLLGAMTFFLPCGFTQAMQLYALTTGNPVQAGLIMATFALGTTPGLLFVGALSNINLPQSVFRFVGVIVIVLGMFNIGNSLNLLGINVTTDKPITGEISNEVRMTESGRGYSPNRFKVAVNKPVRWIIDAREPYSCASSLMVPKLGIRKNLQLGENIIEFTPTQVGKLPFSCSMGMYTGEFEVI